MEHNKNENFDDGKTTGIISYIWLIGWVIAYFFMHKDNKTELGSYQLRQTLLFAIISTGIGWTISILTNILIDITGIYSLTYLGSVFHLGLFVLWGIGFIGAINGEKKPIPFIGKLAQELFPKL